MKIIVDKSVETLIRSLEKPTIAKVLRIIDLLQQFGPTLGMPYSRSIREKLFELRVRGKQEIRIFYTFYNSQVFLLHGFIKKTLKTPTREINTALKRLKELTAI